MPWRRGSQTCQQLDAADLGTSKATKHLLFGHGPECNVLYRVESISAYFLCDIVRHAFVIANDPPHLLHRFPPVHEQRKQSLRARGTGRDRDSTPPCTTSEHVSYSSEKDR
ncbi:hypothetical protein BLNAU_21220 [Blattamonas nauphoetae]|uniref:Uncharacterized protein n=1 Tax=Blattamonas nauphoetae TaxID=2049346 RepID=A0ABQ9WX31_9EUKA|nr:hypothetical protein BLNAU_21220 [Blattamonas nauphoetae]